MRPCLFPTKQSTVSFRMADLVSKKVCDLPHGYTLYEIKYSRTQGTLSTGDRTRELDRSRKEAREEGPYKRIAPNQGDLKILDGESKSFTNTEY